MTHGKTDNKRQQKPTEETDFAKEPLSDKIGDSLRQMYKEVVDEAIPDEFLDILKRADG